VTSSKYFKRFCLVESGTSCG